METKIIQVTENLTDHDLEKLSAAAGILRSGGLVAFPTETVYGLGGNALDEKAAEKIYKAKGRPSDNPLIAHISCMEELMPLVRNIPQAAVLLAEKYWPGPLTMIFEKSDIVPFSTTGGLDTVAVRMPLDPVANVLIKLAKVPVAAPSANISGKPSPTSAEHVKRDLNGKIDMIVDGGPVGIGLESTIVDITGKTPVILRPGAITYEMLAGLFPRVDIDPAILEHGTLSGNVHPKAPGMKYRHYAPKAELTIIMAEKKGQREADSEDVKRVSDKINALSDMMRGEGHKVGIICTDETKENYRADFVESIGSKENGEMIAHNLYRVLRDLDETEVEYIFSEGFPENDIGQAVMNRLSKAAGQKIIYV